MTTPNSRISNVFLPAVLSVMVIALLGTTSAESAGGTKFCADKKTGIMRYLSYGVCKASERLITLGAQGTTGPKGEIGLAGPQGLQGPQGDQGPKGEDGISFPQTAASMVDPDAPLKLLAMSASTGCVAPEPWGDVSSEICRRSFTSDESLYIISASSNAITIDVYSENCQGHEKRVSIVTSQLPIQVKKSGSAGKCVYLTSSDLYSTITYSNSSDL